MADDWLNYLPNEWGGWYWQNRFNDPTYNPKSWYEHADRWLCELLKKGAYYNNEWNDYEWNCFFHYLHRHFEDCQKQNFQQYQRNLENNQRQLSAWQWQNQLNKNQFPQQNYNFDAWQDQLNQQKTDLDQREQDLQQNQRKFKNALKELAEKSRQLNLMEERLNKREVELKLREQKLERMESAGKNNSSKSNFYASSSDDDRYPSNVNNFDNISSPQKSAVSIDKTPAYTQNIRQSPEVKLAPTQKVSISAKDEFNEMMNKTGQDFRQARQNFIKNRNVRAFKCSNSSLRMRTPVPKPIFGEVDEISEGDFWAVKIPGNKFAVFPNVKNYTNNHHEERAMGDVFDSNFVPGKVYKNISVEQPAIFDCDGSSWRLSRKGELRLSGVN